MRVLEAVKIIVLAAALFPTLANADQRLARGIDENPFVPLNDQVARYKDDFPWKFVGCRPVYDLRQPSEPLIGEVPVYDLAYDGDPLLSSYQEQPDGNQQVYIHGHWVRFDKIDFSTLCPALMS